MQNRNEKYKFETFITDFEIGLYNTFNKVFDIENDIKQIGCYFNF